MSEAYKKFIKDSQKVAFDKVHREKINFNISRYDKAVIRGREIYKNIDLAGDRANMIKKKVLNVLDKKLIDFQRNFEDNGGKIIWAEDAKQAVEKIVKLLKDEGARKVVKSKSMISEEIELNKAFEKEYIDSLETDLGEYIVQLAGEKPYHIVTPAMHMSKEDVAGLFNKKFDLPADSKPEEITAFVRELLRKKFVEADVGITGANFLVADSGSVAITENEGNGMMSFSFPRIHIAIAGIEKIIPTLSDLDLFWPMLAVNGTGQPMTVYNSILSGPRQDDEDDGPGKMYLVLLDNKRSEVLAHERTRVALACIRCGACLNCCPVYKNIGGHTYGVTYSGPIGSIVTPHLRDLNNYRHLSFASSLCGRCTEVCPVRIPLHELLLANRNEAVEKGFVGYYEKMTVSGMTKVLMSRKRMDLGSSGLKNAAIRRLFGKTWGARRDIPQFSGKSFRKLYAERKRRRK